MRNLVTLKAVYLLVAILAVGLLGFSTVMAQETPEGDLLTGKTVNINTGTLEELAAVPRITQELAEAIVEYREENGDFQVLPELLQVDGFSRELLRRIKPFLLLEGIGGDSCTC